MRKYLFLVIFISVSFPAFAEMEKESKNPYLSFGFGSFQIKNLKLPKFEQNIIKNSNLITSSSIDDESDYQTIALGWCGSVYWCLEIARVSGLSFSTKLVVQEAYGIPVNLTFSREVKVTAMQYTVLGSYAVNDWFSVFGRAGLYDWKIHLQNKLYFPNNEGIFLSNEARMSGVDPTASAGLSLRLNQRITIWYEGARAGKIEAKLFSLVYKRPI